MQSGEKKSKTRNTAKEKKEKDLGERIYQFVIRIVNLVNELLPKNRMGPIIQESEEIKKILTRSLKTATQHPDRRGEIQVSKELLLL